MASLFSKWSKKPSFGEPGSSADLVYGGRAKRLLQHHPHRGLHPLPACCGRVSGRGGSERFGHVNWSVCDPLMVDVCYFLQYAGS